MVFPQRKRQDQENERPAGPQHIPGPNEPFGVMWTDYYALVAKGFRQAVSETSGQRFQSASSDLLVRVSQESTLHLLWDYINSSVWTNEVLPLVQGPDETVNALLRYLASLRWENSRLCSLIPRQELIIEVDETAPKGQKVSELCQMTAGAAAAIMDLLYGEGETPEKRLFSFRCVETECRTKGAPACRFVVSPSPKTKAGNTIRLDFTKR